MKDTQMKAVNNSPIHIVFLDRETLPPETELKPLSFPHKLTVYDRTAPHEVASRIAAADYVITNKVPLGQAQLEAAPRLKLIAIAATGYDVVDIRTCAAKNVAVVNIRNYAVNSVPEHTFALILGLRRSILAYRESVQAGRWQEAAQFCYFDYPVNDLSHSTLGIIGDGALGKMVGDLGRAFGMKVLFSAYKNTEGMGPLYTPFEEVMAKSDVITLHAPLLPSTRHMISDAEFALMERRPLIINTARGGLVDEEALARALHSGRIAGAGFDVVTSEPPPRNHVFLELLKLPNFILTPHVAWSSREAIQGLADQLVQNIELFNSGHPRHLVSA
jgi:glycerate dehydrogenase